MSAEQQHNPPRWAQRLLEWYCKPELLEDLQGDLNEYFERNVKVKGARRARFIYILDVFKFFRLYTIRKPKFINLLIQWIMIGSYVKTSGRNMMRNKLFSTINIIGLAISMSVGLLLIIFLSDLLSYDSFHAKGDRLYRVIAEPHFKGEERSNQFASTSVKTGNLIREKFTGVEDVTILCKCFFGDAHVNENVVPIEALYADESFFKVFTFPMLAGNSGTALKEPYSIVLTEKSAKKLFGNGEALGKSVRFDSTDYVVTGVLKDVPFFSHIQFESLISFSTLELQNKGDKDFLSWTNMWNNYVYLTLPEGAHASQLQSNLDKLCTEENKAFQHTKIFLSLQPLNEIVLGKDLSNAIGPFMMESVVWVIGGLALIVILSACFNYTNLSIARALRRSREVGIRKVTGASKSQVLSQFVTESVIIALLALVFSFIILMVLKPQFLTITPELRQMVKLELTPNVIVYFIIFAMVVGVLAGFLPALFFSRINAIQVMKDISSMKVFRQLGMRKVLIVVQYTFSLIFITTTFIGLKQYKNFLSLDLGFSTENVLNIKLQGNKPGPFIKELSEMPEVTSLSQSFMVTNVGNYWGGYMKYIDQNDSALVWYNGVDEQYLPLHGHKLLAGRNFSTKPSTIETEVIVNEQILKRFNIANQDPEKALGEIVSVDGNEVVSAGGQKMVIVGVMKDFHYGKADNLIEPVIFRTLGNEKPRYINAKIKSTDWSATLGKIEAAWKKIDKVHPLDAKFYDEQIEEAYNEFSALIKIIGFLAFLAISISSLGLFGMVVFTTETKLKEISIRKVLGAGEGGLIYLLSKGFVILLSLSACIALPVTYLLFDQLVLSNFAYHLPIGVELTFGFILVMVIAFAMIGSQTLKIARTNPATVLKNE